MRTRTAVIVATTVVGVAIAFAFAACSDTSTSAPSAPDSLNPSFAKGGQPNKVKSISLSPSSATIDAGSTLQLTATANPPGSATTFAWTSSNTAVATVTQTGVVTANA